MSGPRLLLRSGAAHDLEAVNAIQAACPEAAQWMVRDYLAYDCLVAVWEGRIAGFAVVRALADEESELLNLAVGPEFRRLGIGQALLFECARRHPGVLWLEVRESNDRGRKFYERMGFTSSGQRPDYYSNSAEAAIVMKFHS